MHMTLPLVEPIRPALARSVPTGREWQYELKLDGFRGVFYVENGRGSFRSKSNRVMRRFAGLADRAARSLDVKNAILDGEIVVLTRSLPDFAALMSSRGQPEYAAFDLVWLNGRDLRGRPYAQRKKTLKELLETNGTIGYVACYREPELFEAAARLDLEGIVAKRARDTYAPDTTWIKVKHGAYSQNEGRRDLFRR